MNTCGTCKHFGSPVNDQADATDDHVPAGYHRCMLIELRGPHDKESPSAVVVDASVYYAALCVKEEFGCNQWEPPVLSTDRQFPPLSEVEDLRFSTVGDGDVKPTTITSRIDPIRRERRPRKRHDA